MGCHVNASALGEEGASQMLKTSKNGGGDGRQERAVVISSDTWLSKQHFLRWRRNNVTIFR